MQGKVSIILVFLLSTFFGISEAQPPVSIPAYTAYAVPAEKSNEDGDSQMFNKENGLQNWRDTGQDVMFYFKIRKTGKLSLSLLVKNKVAGNRLSAFIAGKRFSLTIPASNDFNLINIGSVEITDTGFYSLSLSSLVKKGETIADIRSLELSGEASVNVYYNPGQRRNAASVHLFYPLPDSVKALSFYNEITIPKDADPLHSYFMACGFARGYFGIQVNSLTERRVIFSVWDAGTEATDRKKVADENKVQLIAKGEDVFADGFGNEGTGGHSHWLYNWKSEQTYKFLVTAAIDSASNTTTYTGYFFIPEIQKWKLIACFKAPKDGKPLRKLYSFVENFDGANGQLYRKAYYGNPWIRRDNGEWAALTESKFSYDATGRSGDRIDYGGGADSNRFYLWNGGFTSSGTSYGEIYKIPASNEKPTIDLYKNADSAAEYRIEHEEILNAVRSGKLDTTGSDNGIYYKILSEGTGDPVNINDSIVVHYKGKLMNDFVFNETKKDEPATFALKRLIKGWQYGLPHCRQGGKIRLIIPSRLAYSIRNLDLIPPNSILIFDVEVLEIRKL